MDIEFRRGPLTAPEQKIVTEGFRAHTREMLAPDYIKERVAWLGIDEQNELKAALTTDILWNWLYVDELWVCQSVRGAGLGRRLMQLAEEFAVSQRYSGIWLWTQSWQAEDFYRQLGYGEFTRFDDFPKGHSRIGFRKQLVS